MTTPQVTLEMETRSCYPEIKYGLTSLVAVEIFEANSVINFISSESNYREMHSSN